jgi:hypothetical protein
MKHPDDLRPREWYYDQNGPWWVFPMDHPLYTEYGLVFIEDYDNYWHVECFPPPERGRSEDCSERFDVHKDEMTLDEVRAVALLRARLGP